MVDTNERGVKRRMRDHDCGDCSNDDGGKRRKVGTQLWEEENGVIPAVPPDLGEALELHFEHIVRGTALGDSGNAGDTPDDSLVGPFLDKVKSGKVNTYSRELLLEVLIYLRQQGANEAADELMADSKVSSFEYEQWIQLKVDHPELPDIDLKTWFDTAKGELREICNAKSTTIPSRRLRVKEAANRSQQEQMSGRY
mmetsp:Transcript_2085/g.5772  ORF Transcript_2085/g.5772 Transcript_2085/m.5772 type:complete len:197 (-) Transcript_2085:53-643(-)